MTSPLEMAAACRNPLIMSIIIEKKSPSINIDTFDIVFKSNCGECLDVLLDHAYNFSFWSFNRNLFEKIFKLSLETDDFIIFISKFAKNSIFMINWRSLKMHLIFVMILRKYYLLLML